MYPTASNVPQQIDDTFVFIIGLSIIALVGITATMVWFLIRYHHKRNPEATQISGHVGLEITWTVIPTILFLLMFYYGWAGFKAMRTAPKDAMVVQVEGYMYGWTFTYPNGREYNELNVPVDKPIKVELSSRDVLHSFFVPAYRIKMDAVPGQDTYTWFQPRQVGEYDILCTEYCGVGHAYMFSRVNVMEADAFREWYGSPIDEAASEAEREEPPGLTVLNESGCRACHSLDGSEIVGPSLKGLYGKERTVTVEGGQTQTVTADEDYIRRAINEPNAEVVEGYAGIMPANPLPREDISKIIEYLKTLQ